MDPLIAILNDALGSIANAMSRSLTRSENLRGGEKVGLRFTGDTIAFRPEVPTTPKHVWCTRLTLENGSPVTAAWSLSWALTSSGTVAVTFQGLAASTTHLASFLYE